MLALHQDRIKLLIDIMSNSRVSIEQEFDNLVKLLPIMYCSLADLREAKKIAQSQLTPDGFRKVN